MEYKSTITDFEETDDRAIAGFASVAGNIDGGNDRIWSGAFRKTLKENSERVQHLWQHDMMQPPTAVIVDLKEVKRIDLPPKMQDKYPQATGALLVVRRYLDTPRGDEVLTGIKSGAIKEMSIGYDPIKFDFEELTPGSETNERMSIVRNLRELRLWDTSDVNWGMNALTQARTKKAVPFHSYGTAEEGTAWSAPGLGDFSSDTWDDMSDADKNRIAMHFAWSDGMPPETFGGLKLPHHQPSTSGHGAAVWRGVAAAMGALMGSRGGVAIPDSDRRGVYNHLVSHYEEFGKEPPDYKWVELGYQASLLSITEPQIKVGRVLSERNLSRLKEALATLQDILSAAEPPADEDEKARTRALTAKVLQRLAIYERTTYKIT